MKTITALLFFTSTLFCQHLELTSRLGVVGNAIGFSITPDTAIKSITFYSGSTIIAKTGFGGVHSFTQNSDGWKGYYAEIWHTAGSFQRTDTAWAFICTRAELDEITKDMVVYQYLSKTFPDTAIALPSNSLILGYTHYTSLKTLLKYLSPILRK